RDQVIEQLWATNVKAADYSFNRSHAACYALIAYRTAWLKANYPAEYMAALISSVMSTKDKVPFFATQAEQMGIEILPPDVNVSDHDFVVSNGNIRFGLDAVKGVGYAAVEAIKAARHDGGPFASLWDFCARVDARAVNKKAIEALIKCGAFGSTGSTRMGMLMVLEQAQGAGQKAQQDLEIGQGSIFDSLDFGGGAGSNGAAAAFAAPAHPPIPPEEFDQPELLAIEKESIGLFISAHPLKQVREALREVVDCSLSELAQRKDKDWVSAGGIITAAKKIRTRNGEHMMFATLDDLEGCVEILVFGKALAEYEGALDVDSVVVVRGRVDHKDADKTCLVVQSAEPFVPTAEEVERARATALTRKVGPEPLHVRVHAAGLPDSAISDLKHLLANFPGESEVVLEFHLRSGDPLTLKLGPSYRVAPTPTLRAELEHVLGPAALIAV
ncbi:MAG: polymerase subunit alpha, partial [Solirubrobacteraceae bacterium]|nr:polymerase subunit alpha [Solirubrobacteraceae bacterium]